MALTYDPIATTTASGSSSSITFSSISGTYTDLRIVVNCTNDSGANYGLFVKFNSDTASNYSFTRLYGDGTSAISNRGSSVAYATMGWTSSGTLATFTADLNNYANTTTYKTLLNRNSSSVSRVGAVVSLWRSTSAITSIEIYNESNANFTSGSTFTLYGIKAA